jgi:NAD-dependent SIR2 family protein deacetylase
MNSESMAAQADRLAESLLRHGPALVLTGAGCSTASGIPDYRDRNGDWKHSPPVMFNDFVRNETTRKRYWAGSMNGWPRIQAARPNPAHHALSLLERGGFIHTLLTQNVDGLHHRAGSRSVIELHGNLKSVICLRCGTKTPRSAIQAQLMKANAAFRQAAAAVAPDGDAVPGGLDYDSFETPVCDRCSGILKPEVVFFGEAVPRSRTEFSLRALAAAGCLLTAGTSLMVFSGYRYCLEARRRSIPVIAVNLGHTRADGELDLKIEADCGRLLTAIAERLCPREDHRRQVRSA